MAGFYDDEAVRTVGGWRLSGVKLTATHQDNAHLPGLAAAAARAVVLAALGPA